MLNTIDARVKAVFIKCLGYLISIIQAESFLKKPYFQFGFKHIDICDLSNFIWNVVPENWSCYRENPFTTLCWWDFVVKKGFLGRAKIFLWHMECSEVREIGWIYIVKTPKYEEDDFAVNCVLSVASEVRKEQVWYILTLFALQYLLLFSRNG